MKTITIKEGCSTPVNIGEKGENGVGAVLFDYSEWLNDFGNGAISLLVKRKGDSSAYPVVLTTADGIATWPISDTDTAVQGYGKAEYVFTVDDKIAKSAVFSFFVAQDLGTAGDPPDPYESWIDTLTALGGETLINAQAAQAAQEAAETAQSGAETAEQNAEGHATNAAQSAGSARFAAESALSSADSASASATAASGHATAAEAARDLAISAAEDAQHSETQAELSASAAAEDAESASQSASSASSSASSASASAQSASGSASSASASATTATNAATSATTSANNAAQSATAASGSATAAATSETNAAASATSASGSASAAATSAEQAAESAEKADIDLLKLLPTDTASGAIASFPDGADGVPVKSLTVAVEPVQAGSGDPSPDNVRPISGRTEATVTRTGVNVLNLSEWECEGGSGITIGTDNISIINRGYQETLNRYNVLNRSAYVFSFHVKVVALSDSRASFAVYADGPTKLTWSGMLGSVGTEKDITLTVPNGTEYISFGGWAWSGEVQISNLQLELASTATAYEPYTAQTITIPFGQTVYGATLDVVQGVCTVDRAMVTIYNTDIGGVSLDGNNLRVFLTSTALSVFNAYKDGVCNKAVIATSWSATGGNANAIAVNAPANKQFIINKALASTQAEAEAFIGTDGLQICTELATPITIPLTANELTTLLGQNNIWSDSGDVDVTYRADIQKYITKVISEALA